MYKRNGIWYTDFKDSQGNRVIRSTGSSNRQEANVFEDRLRRTVEQKVSLGPTLKEAIEYTWRVSWSHNKDGEATKRMALRIPALIGQDVVHVGEITTDTLLRLKETLIKSGRSPATANRHLSCLRKVLTDCTRRGVLDKMPYIPMTPERQGRIRVITPEEEVFLLDNLESPYDDLIAILLDTGMRLGEALAIDHQKDYSTLDRSITVWTSKTDHPRTIPATTRVHEVFCRGDFRGLHDYNVDYRWNQVRSALGLEGDREFVVHACRHTCASRMVRAGVSLYVVKEILGHASIKTTERYSHLNPASRRAGIDALEQFSLKS